MPPPRGLVQQLDQHLHRHPLLPRRARLLVAVSGGADSVALLRLLDRINQSTYWQWEFQVAHIDHGMRGAGAGRADARFVRDLAGELGLPFHLKELRLGKSASEDAARTARLAALSQVARELRSRRTPCHAVVMAHHADDQAETVLMRMFRGCGLEGLSAMSAETCIGELVVLRPLLHLRRPQLRQYLSDIGQTWREDESNALGQYLRNRIRNELLPHIELIYPQAVPSLARLAHLAAQAHAVIIAAAEKVILRNAAPRKKSVTLPRRALRSAPAAVAAEVLRRLIASANGSPQTADFERLDKALHLARGSQGQKQLELSGGLRLTFRGGAKGTVTILHGDQPRHRRGRR